MSLLLEALKKAEKAKQEHSAKPAVPELGPGAPRVPISEPGQADVWEAEAPAPMRAHTPAGLSLEDLPPPGALKPQAPAGEFPGEQRKGAEAMFAAKRSEQGRKTVIIGLLAVLLLVFAGGGIYMWWEVSRPSAPAIQVLRPMAPAPVAKAPVIPPVAPASSAAEPAPAPAAQAPAKDEKAVAETARPTPARRAAAAPQETASPVQIKRTQPDTTVNPALAAAYEAFNAGDLARAEQGYLRLLGAEPRNRDALLGLAAIALMRNHNDEAERHYLRLLEQDPRDPLANAGLMAMRTRADPRQVESRLKLLIAQQPEAAALHFSLGNVYAGESRWAEAQAAYFRAVSVEPGNADYAFNLAVSLDHLNQNKHAADYYRRALALATRGPAGFDRQRATNRLRELEQFP